MEIIDVKILRGPNYWSNVYKELIVLVVNAEYLDGQTTQTIKGFSAKLENIFPSFLKPDHLISNKFKQGIPINEMVAHIAKELQILAGIQCDFVMTQATNNGLYTIAYSYTIEQAGIYAGQTALKIISALIENRNYNTLQNDLEVLINYKLRSPIGPTTSYLLEEIKKREIPYRKFNEGSLIILGHGINQKKIRTAITDTTSGIGMELAGDKDEAKKLLSEAHIPVPKGILVTSEQELRDRIGTVQFPLVIKPLNGNEGRGVTTNIRSVTDAVFGFQLAKKISPTVIIEEFINGNDYRFLVIDYKLVAVAERIPATITGDGKSTIFELIEKENQNIERGAGPEHILDKITIDEITMKILVDGEFTLNSILADGEALVLKDTANISTGGTAEDVTDTIHTENVFLAERIARRFNLNICGIDIIALDVALPITRETGAVIEVNADPGLRMHSNPQKGASRNVAADVIDMLYPDKSTAFIHIVAVEDFDQANILTRLIAHFAKQAGYKPGCNTSEGIYIQEHLTYKGNCMEFEDIQEVLFEPGIDFAVLQCSNLSILTSGLGFDKCDISIVADFPQKAMTQDSTFDNLVSKKNILIENTLLQGFVILNANNDISYNNISTIKCNVALFSSNKDDERIKQHYKAGGLAAVMDKETMVVYNGNKILLAMDMRGIPLTFEDDIDSIAKVILPAVLTAVIKSFPTNIIRESLISFSLRETNNFAQVRL